MCAVPVEARLRQSIRRMDRLRVVLWYGGRAMAFVYPKARNCLANSEMGALARRKYLRVARASLRCSMDAAHRS